MQKTKYFTIQKIRVDITQIPETVLKIQEWIRERLSGKYIVVTNANDIVMGIKTKEVMQAINQSDLSVPDGFSLVITARLKGYNLGKRVYGPDLMLEVLRMANIEGYSSFFYGSTESTLISLKDNLKNKFPNLKIAGYYAPPFRRLTQQEDDMLIDMINKTGADILWVGLGCPKQQLWMYEHRDKIRPSVMIGVGAAFDFLSGTKIQAPRWLRDNGFEWLFRLLTEPKRLWQRYLITLPLFLYYLCKDMLASE